MCPNCRAFITTDDKICPYCNTKVGARAVDLNRPKDALGGLIPQARFTTVILMLINTGLYLGTVLYTQHKSSLFTLNIRNYIGDTATNKAIKKTAIDDSKEFFFFNNGISALAESIVADEEDPRRISRRFL